ncbi:glycosyltransferase [Clostridium sp. HBUAS56017]|uniref:glycosyltransferase n=1 Tax=Clostridium sp. HBUAS56017 TaxID=2571128 RepID=UPI001177E3C2|nr:glycosyltransferase [Clostridium sp. HBUAS56017]
MRTVAFYISDHGFGHASRNIPIIGYILEANSDVRVIVKTGKYQGEFIKGILKKHGKRLIIYSEVMDVGLILKSGSLEVNKRELEKSLMQYINTWNERSIKEQKFLKKISVDIVVSDIVPWIFKSTSISNVPSLLISNFTWVDIYDEYFDSIICEPYRKCYELADRVLLYSLYIDNMKSYLKNYEEVGLCCRAFSKENVQKIKEKYKKKIVFISVGRSVELNGNINVENLNYDFIVTEGINIEGNNVTYLSKDIANTHDYVKASDYVITKAGWGTIAEVLCANKKCAILSRNSVAEDRNTIEKLKYMNLALEINYEESFDIGNILKQLDGLKVNNDYKFENQYKDIAKKIVSYIGDR